MTAPSWWRPKKSHQAGSIEARQPPLHHYFRLLTAGAGSPDLKLAQQIEKQEEKEFQVDC